MGNGANEVTQIQSHDSDPAQAKPGTLWIMWIFLTLIIYVLGIGPVAKFSGPNQRIEKALGALYSPLLLLADKCAPVHGILTWYIVDVWQCR